MEKNARYLAVGYALLTVAAAVLLMAASWVEWMLPLSVALPGDQSGLYALMLAFVLPTFLDIPGIVLQYYAILSPVAFLLSVWFAAARRKFGGLKLVLILNILFPAVLLLLNGRVGDLDLDPLVAAGMVLGTILDGVLLGLLCRKPGIDHCAPHTQT